MEELLTIYIGPPEDDVEVTAKKSQTVEQIYNENNVEIVGDLRHNGKSVNKGKTLSQLNVKNEDSITTVIKTDNA